MLFVLNSKTIRVFRMYHKVYEKCNIWRFLKAIVRFYVNNTAQPFLTKGKQKNVFFLNNCDLVWKVFVKSQLEYLTARLFFYNKAAKRHFIVEAVDRPSEAKKAKTYFWSFWTSTTTSDVIFKSEIRCTELGNTYSYFYIIISGLSIGQHGFI